MTEDLPALVGDQLPDIDTAALRAAGDPGHKPRILLLYGSLRDVSYSRKAAEEAARILRHLGCETRIFDPRGLPLPDGAEPDHPKVVELRNLAVWSEGMVWSSPERHGAMTGKRRVAIVQRGEPDAHSGPLDAHGDDPEPIQHPKGMAGIRQ